MKETNEILKKLDVLEDERKILMQKRSRWFPLLILFPVLAFLFGAFYLPFEAASIMSMGLVGAISSLIYYLNIGLPFNELKYQVREALLKEFMRIYHPNIKYRFYPEEKDVRLIVNSTSLINANRYQEEDVLEGNFKHGYFYISEIKLQQKSGKSTRTVFDGMLFRLKLKGKNFPHARIQSKPGLIKRLFGDFKTSDYGFWYETENEEKFLKEIAPLFPFIQHLAVNQGDIRIQTKGEELIIMMSSDMKFLDDPKPVLNQTFKKEKYYQNIGKQLNTLLYIMESFVEELDKTAIEERLELKALEYLERAELKE